MANRSQACSSGEAGAADAALSAAMPPTAGLSPRARAQRQPPEDSGPPGEARGSSQEGGPAKALAKLLPQKPETGVSSGGGNPGSAPGGRSSSLSKTGLLTPAPPALCSGAPALACCTAPGPRAGRPGDSPGGSLPARLEHPGPLPAAACARADWPRRQELFPDVRCFFTGVARPQPRGSPLWRVPCSGMNPRGRGGALFWRFSSDGLCE